MDMCYIDDKTKTAFVPTEYGYMAFNPKTADFDVVLDGKDAIAMIQRARVVSPGTAMDYGIAVGKEQQQTQQMSK